MYGLSGNWAISFDNLYQGTLLKSSATKTIRPSPLQTSMKAGKTLTPALNREKGVTETESITSVLKNVPQIIMAARTSTPFFQRWLFL